MGSIIFLSTLFDISSISLDSGPDLEVHLWESCPLSLEIDKKENSFLEQINFYT